MADNELKQNLFDDVKYLLTGQISEQVQHLLNNSNAKLQKYTSGMITHCIAGVEADPGVCEEVKDIFEKPVVTASWVSLSAYCNKLLPAALFDPAAGLFARCTFCMSQVNKSDLHILWALITVNGGKVQPVLNSTCTHLICGKAAGRKYEEATKFPDLRVVTPDWIVHCITQKCQIGHEAYHPSLLIEQTSQVSSVGPVPGTAAPSPAKQAPKVERLESEKVEQEGVSSAPPVRTGEPPIITASNSKMKVASNLPPHLEQQIQQHSMAKSNLQSTGSPAGRPGRIARSASGPQTTWRPTAQPRQPLEQQAIVQRSLSQPAPPATPQQQQQQQQQLSAQAGAQVKVAPGQQMFQTRPVQHLITLQGTGNRPTAFIMQQQVRPAGSQEDLMHHVRLQQPNRPQLVSTRLPVPAASQEAQKLQPSSQANKVPQQTPALQQHQQQVEQKSNENTEENQPQAVQQSSAVSSNPPTLIQQQQQPALLQQQGQVQQQGVQKQQEGQVVQQQPAGNQQQHFLITPQQDRTRFVQPGQQQQVQFTQRIFIQQQPGQHIQQLQVVQKQNFLNIQQQQVQMQQQMTQSQLQQHLQQQQQILNQVDGQSNHMLQSHQQGPQQAQQQGQQQGQQPNQQITVQNQQQVQQIQQQQQQQAPLLAMQQQGLQQVQNQPQQHFQQQPTNQMQQKPQIMQQIQQQQVQQQQVQQQQQQVLLNFQQGQPQHQPAQQAAHQVLQQPNAPQVQQVQRPPQQQGMQQIQQHLMQQQLQQRQIQLQQQQQQMQQAQYVQQRQMAPQQQVMSQQQGAQQIGPNQPTPKPAEMQQQQPGGTISQMQQQQPGANPQQQGQQQVLVGVPQQQMNAGVQDQPRQFLAQQQNPMQQTFVLGQAVQQGASNQGVVAAGQQQSVRQPMPQFVEQGQQIMRPGLPQQIRPFTLQQQQQLQLHLQRLDPQSRQQLQQMTPQARTLVLQRMLQQHELQMQSKQRMMLQQQPLQQQQQQPGETNVTPQQHMMMQRPPVPQQVVVRNVVPFPQQQQQQQVQQQAGQAAQHVTPTAPQQPQHQQQQDVPGQEQQAVQPPPAAQQHPQPAASNSNEQQSTMVNQVNPKTKTALANLLNTRLQGSPASQVPPQQQQQQQQPLQQVHLPQQASAPAVNPQQQILAQQQQQQRRGLLNATNGPPQVAAQVAVPAGAAASPAVIQQHQPKLAVRMPGPVNAPAGIGAPPAIIRREMPVQQLFGHEPGVRLPEKLYFLGCVFLIHEYSKSVPVAEIQSWVKIIQNSGGEVEPAYSPRITHVICENTRSPVVQQAMREGKRLVTAYWLNDVVVKEQMVPPWQVLHFPTPFGEADRPCKNLRASISGFEGDDRARVKFMCDSIGLKNTGHFSRQHDLLICRKPEGPKYQKAREWRKPVVTVQWLAELHFGFLLALQQMHHPKYQHFIAPHYVQDPFRFEMVMATALLVAWRMPVRLTQEIVEKAKPLAEMKAKRRLSTASANNEGSAAGSESPSKKKPRLEGDDKDKPEKNSSNLDAILDDVAKGGFDADGKPRPAVRFSGLDQSEIIELTRLMVPLGLSIATSNKESTHLVMSKLQRTPKFLSCLPFVRFVVSSKWIRDSAEQGKLLDEAGYLLEDSDYEKKFNFSLRALLETPNRDQLFRGKTFYVTPSVLPARPVLTDMIESSGGKVATQRKSIKNIIEMNQVEENSYLVVSCEADLHLVSDLARAKISIYNTEFVMSAIVTQKIPFKSCAILP